MKVLSHPFVTPQGLRTLGERMLSAKDHGVGSVAMLTPKKRNIHAITALEDQTVFADILVPGYQGRHCRYFVKEEKNVIRGQVYWIKEAHPAFSIGRWLFKPNHS